MTNNIVKRTNGHVDFPARTTIGSLVDRFFQHKLISPLNDEAWGFNGLEHQVQVPVNLQENDKSYELELVAPGLKKEDFTLSVTNDLLTVAFERKDEQQQRGNGNWLRKEYRLQSFSRSFNLDDSVDTGKITAAYKDGILQLTLPKKEHAQRISKTIEVK